MNVVFALKQDEISARKQRPWQTRSSNQDALRILGPVRGPAGRRKPGALRAVHNHPVPSFRLGRIQRSVGRLENLRDIAD